MSQLFRRSIVALQSHGISLMQGRAAPAKAAAKKKGGAPSKKKNSTTTTTDRGTAPLKLEAISPSLFTTQLPSDANSEYPAWLFEIDDQLPRDKPVRLLTPEDEGRYFKQKARHQIKERNAIMLATKGKGL
ncbi:hypothetical protein DFA_04717 [Cavenderia fasciculata]|uniref:Ribosomal protein L37 n=1 Tax=Cavenderia fasciculata TaxID=261658 RepID=F4PQC4_CACFS|nr:uncharacterized protein DFA_04717 [Cavenderia fasciculata]EGG22587.1 hypothetical protein DFA_04717 [Cavenderia fasciculata]|eukprot:XP_004360438.1 hypothetical protein DFA_04717 [Cavenderia fasciculata]